MEQIIQQWQEETDAIIAHLLADGSDPDAIYTIEHHFASGDFKALEKAAIDFFKAGYEVTDAEEAQLDDGAIVFSFDVITELPLEATAIKADVAKLVQLCGDEKVFYDGWGTYFEDPDDEDDFE